MTLPAPLPEFNTMNKTEMDYAERLEVMRQKGVILAWRYESLTFRLAHRTTYTPDFLVIFPGHIEIHEVKGFWRDDARVKWKATAEQFQWFKFLAVTRKKGEWKFEEYRYKDREGK